mmetsp:Transcript_5909/g.14209  ORF Transcript_5909/g.14209 Transcript_5909/m.14209 type:complete len:90 (+) Transcript_5909:246-515(+)
MSSDGEGKTPSRALLVDKLRERLRKKDEAEKAAAEAAAAAPPGALGKNGRRDSDLSDASTSQSDSESDKPGTLLSVFAVYCQSASSLSL